MSMTAHTQGNGNDAIYAELQANPFNLSPATSLNEALEAVRAKQVLGRSWQEIYSLPVSMSFDYEVSQ